MIQNKTILWMVLSVLNRKTIVDKQARKNYKQVLFDYILDLESLEKINILPNSSAIKHKQYLEKLLIMNDRFEGIGNDFLEDSSIELFLSKLQDMMRDYLNKDLDNVFFNLRKDYYSNLCKSNPTESTQNYNRLSQLKEKAFANLG